MNDEDDVQLKTTDSEDKTASVPNHSPGNITKGVIVPCKFVRKLSRPESV